MSIPKTVFRLLRRKRRLLIATGITAAAVTIAVTTAVQSSQSLLDARKEASSVSEFLVRLLDLAGPDAHGPELTLPDAWRLAEAAIPNTFADHPYGESRVRMAYGRAYANVENWPRAITHLERAIELLRQSPAAHPISVKWCERLAAQCRLRLSG